MGECQFNIKLHDEQNGLTRFPIDKRWDVISCEIVNKEQNQPLQQPLVSSCNSTQTTWDIRECFKQLRFDKNHHLGLGDIRLTIAQQEEICELVEHFYRCR